MKIYICQHITAEVIKAMENLIPQLCPNCKVPSKEYLEQIIHSNSSLLILAEDNGIIGSLTLILNQIPTCRKAWIEDVVVDKNHRGKGVGKKLIEFAIESVQDNGISKIDLTSRPERIAANELYLKLGFNKRETNVYRLEI